METKKYALVTGGAQRIGRSIVLALSSMGYSIALHYNHSEKNAREIAGEVEKQGNQCEIFSADLSQGNAGSLLVKAAFERFPGLSLLVNNASVFERSTLLKTTEDLFDRQMNLNFKAPLLLSRDFCRSCSDGQIINILDTKVAHNQFQYFAYTLSKKALAEFTKMAALELAPHIRVNGIAPGPILPPKDEDENYLQSLAKKIPLQRSGNPELITHSLRFLLENDYITGQIIYVDGGDHL